MGIKNSIIKFQDYINESKYLFLPLGLLIVFFTFISQMELSGLAKLVFLGIEVLIFFSIILFLCLLIVWTFIKFVELRGNPILLFSLVFISTIALLFTVLVYLIHPIVFVGLLSYVFWFSVGWIIMELSFYIRIKLIVGKNKWYIHTICNILLTFFIFKIGSFIIKIGPSTDKIDILNNSNTFFVGIGIFGLLFSISLLSTFLGIFNKSKGLGLIMDYTNKGKNIDRLLFNKIFQVFKNIKNSSTKKN